MLMWSIEQGVLLRDSGLPDTTETKAAAAEVVDYFSAKVDSAPQELRDDPRTWRLENFLLDDAVDQIQAGGVAQALEAGELKRLVQRFGVVLDVASNLYVPLINGFKNPVGLNFALIPCVDDMGVVAPAWAIEAVGGRGFGLGEDGIPVAFVYFETEDGVQYKSHPQ